MLYGTVYMKQFNIRISEDCNTFFGGLCLFLTSICNKMICHTHGSK